MSIVRFLGRVISAIVGFLISLVVGIAKELFQIAKGLVILVPLLIFDLMLFMFFQESLSMEQADVVGIALVSLIIGWVFGMMTSPRVVRFWKKD
jgi:hypothetical protein